MVLTWASQTSALRWTSTKLIQHRKASQTKTSKSGTPARQKRERELLIAQKASRRFQKYHRGTHPTYLNLCLGNVLESTPAMLRFQSPPGEPRVRGGSKHLGNGSQLTPVSSAEWLAEVGRIWSKQAWSEGNMEWTRTEPQCETSQLRAWAATRVRSRTLSHLRIKLSWSGGPWRRMDRVCYLAQFFQPAVNQQSSLVARLVRTCRECKRNGLKSEKTGAGRLRSPNNLD